MVLRTGDRVVALRRMGGVWGGWVDKGTEGTFIEDRGLVGVRYYVKFDNGIAIDWLTETDVLPTHQWYS